MNCYRVTAELIYYVHAEDEAAVYRHGDEIDIVDSTIHNTRVTVSTVLPIAEEV